MHIFLDMDGTVCESRQDISEEMFERLLELKMKHDIVVISGAEKERMLKQLKGLPVYIMAQSGNETKIWNNKLSEEEIAEIYRHADRIRHIEPDMLDNRGCQVALSLTGHHAPLEVKQKFDPDGSIRTKILQDIPFESETLECRVAGTTCLDYTSKKGTKGKNIKRIIESFDWIGENCVYFGDKLMKGGNDESVVGVIDTIAVENPTDLLNKLKEYE